MSFLNKRFLVFLLAAGLAVPGTAKAGGQDYSGREDPNKKVLKQALVGAGSGAIAAEASGGKAGTGALVGAGTNVLGNALVDTLTAPPQPRPAQQVQYVQPAAPAGAYPVQPVQTQAYRDPQPVYVQQPYYQEDPSKKILKQGLVGAGTGAIAASASGGKAGKGALIGAGTNILGNALLDTLSGPSQPQAQPVYYQQAPVTAAGASQPRKKIVRRYDADGNVVSEEEVWE